MTRSRILIPKEELAAFCAKWKVVELSLFGSVLRDDFAPSSDVDVMVSFEPDSSWSLLELLSMREERKEIFGRDVDLVEKEALRNPFRRREILGHREVMHPLAH